MNLFAPALFAALILAVLPSLASGPKPPIGKWMKELAGAEGVGFTAYPQSLGWQAEHPTSYPAPFLVVGTRPTGDKPASDIKLSGAKQVDTDWVVADSSGAVWVTGLLPAPEPGKTVVLTGRFLNQGEVLAIQGIRFLVAGVRKGKTKVKTGDFVYFPLAGTKSTTCPVEIDGEAAEVAFTDERDTLILRAVKPGTVKIKLFSRWFSESKPAQTSELLLQVE
jgi:hypothetical protein